MKLIVLLTFLSVLQMNASVFSQNGEISLSLNNSALKDVFDIIENNFGYKFIYSDDLVNVRDKVSVDVSKGKIEDVIHQVLNESEYSYRILEDRLVVIYPSQFKTQDLVVKGKVTDSQGIPLPGVNIVEKGTTNGSVTNLDGEYTISVNTSDAILNFSYVGYLTEEIGVNGRTTIDITLVEDITTLEEVVVTALGIEREAKAIGYAAQEIGEDDLSGAREGNISNLLAGKVAGVRINKTGSGLGGSTGITIRGVSSLTQNNQPLFVVDGVPISNISMDSGGTSGEIDLGDGIGDFNPEDIESMSVLKGPSAAALYGSRGANGVVLITTKSGSKKKGIGVEINSNVTWEKINLIPERQNYYATGWGGTTYFGGSVEINGELYPTLGQTSANYGAPMDGSEVVANPYLMPGEAQNTLTLLPQPEDNIANFFDVGMGNANTIAISATGDNVSTRLSIGNSTNTGIYPTSKLNKQTISFNSTARVTDKLSISGKLNYIREEGNNRPGLGQASESLMWYLLLMARYVPHEYLKEYYEETREHRTWPGAVLHNPYFITNELKNNDIKDRVLGNVSMNLEITDWLNLQGRIGTDFSSRNAIRTWPVGSKSSGATGRLIENNDVVKDINADVILTASKDISSSLSISGMVGSSILHQYRKNIGFDGTDFKSEGVYVVSNCETISPHEYLSRKQIQSVFFNGQVAYKNYLFLDFTGRNDWSSTLGINNYSFFYPSISTSFVFTEAFDANLSNILTFGKIRASWAQVGNDSPPFYTNIGYNATTVKFNGQSQAWMSDTRPLMDLKNELTSSFEVGADLRFLQNRLGVDISYYDASTTNQIMRSEISSASGFRYIVMNAGEIENKGVEMMLNLTPIKTNSGFRWDINFNYAKNKSTVVSLIEGNSTYTLLNFYSPNCTVEARVGNAYGDIIGSAYAKAPDGRRLVDDAGRYYKENETSVVGNMMPDWTGGLNNTFSFKGLKLNVLIDIVQGNDIVSNTIFQLASQGTGKFTTEGGRLHPEDELYYVLDGVKEVDDGNGNITYEENDIAVSRMDAWATRAWGQITEEFVLDGSFISLREVMLSYSLPSSILKNTPIEGITISAIGRNLMYLQEHMRDTGVSPESSANTSARSSGIESMTMPTTRTFGLNVKLNF